MQTQWLLPNLCGPRLWPTVGMIQSRLVAEETCPNQQGELGGMLLRLETSVYIAMHAAEASVGAG